MASAHLPHAWLRGVAGASDEEVALCFNELAELVAKANLLNIFSSVDANVEQCCE